MAEPLGYFVVRSVGNPYLVSETPCDREIFGPIEFERANVSRKLIVVEKTCVFRLSYLKEGLKKRGVVI